MGGIINFQLDKPADDQVTTANFAVQVQNVECIVAWHVELTISQKIGFVKKESWEGVISEALGLDPFQEPSQSGTRKYFRVKMQVVRQDPPDESDWEELYIYDHGDDCLLCNFSSYVNDYKTDEVKAFNTYPFM